MPGFFTKKETSSLLRSGNQTFSCASCGLYKTSEHAKMKPFGNFKKGILNIGVAPGETDDTRGKPWQGKAGRTLKQAYRKVGIDLFEDCLNVNAINCRPMTESGDQRTPTEFEIQSCRRIIFPVIKKFKPKVIVLFGNVAIQSLIGHRWKKNLYGIDTWRGFTIPDQDFRAWICPVYHPDFIAAKDRTEVKTIWHQDLMRAISHRDIPFPEHKEPEIRIIKDLSILQTLKSPVAFDYETTGLKPQRKGHRIVTAAITDSKDYAYSFLLPKTRKELRPLLNILTDPSIAKMAHNMKFEHSWTKERLKIEVDRWAWDSMIAAHVLDNRPNTTSLKFQTYVNFGVIDYASEVTPHLKSVKDPGEKKTSGNSFNRLLDFVQKDRQSLERTLYYGGFDAAYTFELSMLQRALIDLPF